MKLLRDTWLLFQRDLNVTLRNPAWLFFGLFQPVCFLLLFAPLLEPIAHAPGFPPGGALTRAGRSSGGMAGSVKQKRAPPPGASSTLIEPSCASTIALQIDRPIPDPGYSPRP